MKLGLSYYPSNLPHHIEADIREMSAIGCNEVMFTLQENHFLYLNGSVRFGAQIARDNGLKPVVDLWGFANTFGGGRMSNILLKDTDLWRVTADGGKQPMGCLNNPKLSDQFAQYAERCRYSGFTGILIDEPTLQNCFCDHCKEKFHEDYGGDLIAAQETEDYKTFQIDTVMRYNAEACRKVKAMDASMVTMTAVMPNHHDCFEPVASIPELDVFGSDPYWLLPANFMDLHQAIDCAKEVKDLCAKKGKISQIWLNCWGFRAGPEPEVYSGGKELAAIGCDSFYTWAFRGAEGTNESCANPQLAWEYLCKLYRELSGK
jgi:hypothetical protein